MKNKILFILISIFIFTGCSGEVTENDTEQSESEVTIWSGPTTGPWETWNRTNNGDQYFKYDLIYGDTDRDGWFTIEIKDLGENNYEFDVELTVRNYFSYATSPDGKTTYNETANFVLNKKEGFFEATYNKREMPEAIYEIIGRLDEQGSFTVNFNEKDIIWEEGASATHEGNGVTVTTLAKKTVLGVLGHEIELQYRDTEKGFGKYIINPDIRYPLYIYEKVIYSEYSSDFYEFTLVEYNYNLKD